MSAYYCWRRSVALRVPGAEDLLALAVLEVLGLAWDVVEAEEQQEQEAHVVVDLGSFANASELAHLDQVAVDVVLYKHDHHLEPFSAYIL